MGVYNNFTTAAITKPQKIKEIKHPNKPPAVSLPNINAIVIRTKQIVIIVIIIHSHSIVAGGLLEIS